VGVGVGVGVGVASPVSVPLRGTPARTSFSSHEEAVGFLLRKKLAEGVGLASPVSVPLRGTPARTSFSSHEEAVGFLLRKKLAEGVGFEPTDPFGVARFRVVCLKPDSAILPKLVSQQVVAIESASPTSRRPAPNYEQRRIGIKEKAAENSGKGCVTKFFQRQAAKARRSFF